MQIHVSSPKDQCLCCSIYVLIIIHELFGCTTPQFFFVQADGICAGAETQATASGKFLFNTDNNQVTYNITIIDLTSELWFSHVHGPVEICETANQAGFVSGLPTALVMIGSYTLTEQQQVEMFDGKHFINVHTDDFPSGEVRGQIIADCNENSIADAIDIAKGNSADINGDGIPDECTSLNRYLPVEPGRIIEVPGLYALRVTVVDIDNHPEFNGLIRWLGPPDTIAENNLEFFQASLLVCEPQFVDWSNYNDMVYAYGVAFPSSMYEIHAVHESCADLNDPACYSAPQILPTAKWSDVIPPYASIETLQPDIGDVLALVQRWLSAPNLLKVQAQLCGPFISPPLGITIDDVLYAVNAWLGSPFPDRHVEIVDCP